VEDRLVAGRQCFVSPGLSSGAIPLVPVEDDISPSEQNLLATSQMRSMHRSRSSE
jgi:hypothetical protein